MVLFITTIDGHCRTREFSCQFHELEQAFDFLNQIVVRGDTLLQACTEEDGQLTQLPLDAFDGIPFLRAIENLKQEWLSVLDHAPESGLPVYGILQELIEWLKKQIDHYEKQMAIIESTIRHFKQLRCRAESCKPHDLNFSPVSDHFVSLLNNYEEQLRKVSLSHQQALNRLRELTIKN
ncbi:hypothetical protein [Spirosoma endbachense]|uniref:Uncharacterized protein n=1 Tax=Spirosoma endbachense TaxID=2666025 RepID=A0A6P1VNZ2_9BACT|nr:hypothetical protein [Spirosoma endbachense]QHV93822.1 hypothetical protein GJR95_01715 [Spirosoma endbachense]